MAAPTGLFISATVSACARSMCGPSAALTAIHLERIAARLYDSHSSHAVQQT
ncbi:MAG: hypothetical protein R3A44_06305 [Caldilineaceae bacterium]